jgi:hypothetical protein
MRRAALVPTLLVAVVLTVAGSDAAVLCRAGSGKLALREQCRKAEQAVAPSQLDLSALAGAQGDSGVAGPRGIHPLKIVDGAGKEIGPIQQFGLGGGVATVAITHPALLNTVFFFLSGAGFVHNIGGAISNVLYALPNCEGVPYLRSFVSTVSFAQVYGDSAYYETGPSASRSFMSSETDPNGSPCGGGSVTTPRGTCCSNVTDSQSLAPAVRVPVADLGFVPPFRAELR